MSADMSPFCSAHDEWLIMKLCMYVGYHDANNVSNFGGDQVTQLNLKKRFKMSGCFMGTAHHSRDAATGFAAVATRPRAGCWSMEDRRRKSLILIGHTSLSTALVQSPLSSPYAGCEACQD